MVNEYFGLVASAFGVFCAWRSARWRRTALKYEAAIKNHRDQRGDDRCWLDDYELYDVLDEGLEFKANNALPDRETFLANCERFHLCRQTAGTQLDAIKIYREMRPKQ